MMLSKYQSSNEEMLHANSTQPPADEAGHDMQLIRQLDDPELMRLQDEANIRDCPALSAPRRTRQLLNDPAENVPSPSVH
jgi:hypothetical protein